jgi:hypothetical protein
MPMSGALLAFNPEAEGTGGTRLLFGVTLAPRPSVRRISSLEELDLASHFLEARAKDRMAVLLAHIIRRASAMLGRPIPLGVEAALLRKLAQSAAVVHSALRPSDGTSGYPMSAEAIFGAELEGLSPEDREFEAARCFVRFAEEVARAAATAAPGVDPGAAAERAERLAARRLAPGLARAIATLPVGFRARRLMRPGHS